MLYLFSYDYDNDRLMNSKGAICVISIAYFEGHTLPQARRCQSQDEVWEGRLIVLLLKLGPDIFEALVSLLLQAGFH